MQKSVFDAIIESGDMFEWSVEACLHASQKHDNRVIEEALSVDECTEMEISQVLNDSILNKSIACPFQVEDEKEKDEEKEEEKYDNVTEIPSVESSEAEEVIKTNSKSASDNAQNTTDNTTK